MRGSKIFSIDALRGVNFSTSPRLVKPNEALIAANARFGPVLGGVEKMGGRNKLADSAFTGPVIGLVEARLGGTDYLVGCSTNEIMQFDFSTKTWSDITKGQPADPMNITATASDRWDFAVVNDLLILTDWMEPIQKWNGTGNTADLGIGSFTTLKCKYLHAFNDILFLGYTNEDGTTHVSRVRWSDGGNPEAWTSTNYADLGLKDGDVIMGITQLQNILVVFKRESIWAGAYVGAPDYFVFEKVVESLGTIAAFSIGPLGNSVYFLGYDGFYVYDGSPIPKRVSGTKIRGLTDGLTEDDAKQVVSVVHPDKEEIWLSTSAETWIYNYLTDDWSKSSYVHGYTSRAQRSSQRETWNSLAGQNITWDSVPYPWDTAYYKTGPVTFVGGDSNGDVHELDVGLDDNGSAQDFQYKTQFIDCGAPQQWKRFLGVKLKVGASDVTLTVDVYKDGGTTAAATQNVTVSSSEMFSEIPGGFTEVAAYFNVVAQSISVRVRNNRTAESVRLYGYTIYYIPREAIR